MKKNTVNQANEHHTRQGDVWVGLATITVLMLMMVLSVVLDTGSGFVKLILWMGNMVFIAAAIWLAVMRYRLARTQPLPEIVSKADAKTVEQMQSMIETLRDLDFELMGVVRAHRLLAQHLEWLYVSNDRTIIATARVYAGTQHGVLFTTVFDSGVVMQTEYPNGDTFDIPNFRSTGVRTSPEAAYHYHLRETTAFGQLYGEPRAFSGIEDWLDWHTLFVNQYGLQKLSRDFRAGAGMFVAFSLWMTGIAVGIIGVTSNMWSLVLFAVLLLVAGERVMRRAMPKGRDIQKHKLEESESTEDAMTIDMRDTEKQLQQEYRS